MQRSAHMQLPRGFGRWDQGAPGGNELHGESRHHARMKSLILPVFPLRTAKSRLPAVVYNEGCTTIGRRFAFYLLSFRHGIGLTLLLPRTVTPTASARTSKAESAHACLRYVAVSQRQDVFALLAMLLAVDISTQLVY